MVDVLSAGIAEQEARKAERRIYDELTAEAERIRGEFDRKVTEQAVRFRDQLTNTVPSEVKAQVDPLGATLLDAIPEEVALYIHDHPPKEGADGKAGADGTDGLGISWRGPWKAGWYDDQDAVEFEGSSYIARTRTRAKPPKGAWDLMAKRGADGQGGVIYRSSGPGGGSSTGGSALAVSDDGTPLDAAVTSLDFTGAGVTASVVGHAVTVDVPGSSGLPAGGVEGQALVKQSAVDGDAAFVPELNVTASAVRAFGAFASVTTDLASANANIVFTSRIVGGKPNELTITYVDPGGNNQPFSLDIAYPSAFGQAGAVTVNLATGAGGAITTTAQNIVDAFTTADAGAAKAVHVTAANVGNGTALVQTGSWQLAGGVDGNAQKQSAISTFTVSGPGSGSYGGFPALLHLMATDNPAEMWGIWFGLDDGAGIALYDTRTLVIDVGDGEGGTSRAATFENNAFRFGNPPGATVSIITDTATITGGEGGTGLPGGIAELVGGTGDDGSDPGGKFTGLPGDGSGNPGKVGVTSDGVTGDLNDVLTAQGDGTAIWAPGGGGAVDSVNGQTGVVVLAAADVGAQPSDADLTAIAALTTTSYGRSLLTGADAAALRALIGVPAMSQIAISQTPTVTNGAYIAEDVIGGLLTFANAALVSAGSGYVMGVTVMCKSPLTTATVPALELALFNQTFTNIADNGAWAPSDADMANALPSIPISSWSVSGNNVLASRFGLWLPYTLTGTSLFGQLITHTGVTLTSTSDIIVTLSVVRD